MKSPSTLAARAVPAGIGRWRADDRAAWLARRQADVTASVAGALFGVHEFVTPYELWHLKAGLLASDPEETPPMRRGRLLEPIALQVLAEDTGWQVEPCGFYYRDPAVRLGATPDGLAVDRERPGFGIVQTKSVEPSVFRSKWQGEDGEIEPPLWIAVQATIEAVLSGASWAVVAPLVIGHGVEVHPVEVPIHAGLMDTLRGKVAEFWRSIDTGAPPAPDFAADGATIAALYPQDNGQELDLTGDISLDDLIGYRDRALADIKAAGEVRDRVDAQLRHRLGRHEAARTAGGRRITWRTQSRALRFQPPSEARVLRVSPAR